jgi:membrane-bound lytic murein transglycosylase F
VLWALLALVTTASADLPQLKQRGTLRVLVFGADEDFLPRAGSPKARDRELLAEFAARSGLTLELHVEHDFNALFTRLLAGDGDVVAHGLTITEERQRRVVFTNPVATVKHLLVGKKGAPGLPRSAAALAGRAVVVHPSSAYAQSLQGLRVAGLTLTPAPEALDTEGVVYGVGRGEFPLTVTDSNVFESIATYNPDVEALFAVAEGKELAWALRPDATALKAALDAFLVEKALTSYAERTFAGDLDGLTRRGSLRLLTWNDPVSYFAYRGDLFGFEYELAKLLAARLKLRLEVVVPPRRELLVPWLLEGRGDVIAASLHPTRELEARATLSRPYLFSELVKVGDDPLTLAAGSTHAALGLEAWDRELDDADLVEKVRSGSIRGTAVDRFLLDSLPTLPPTVPVGTLARDQPVVFATRPASKALARAVDGFVAATYQGLEYNLLRKRYLDDHRLLSAARAEDTARSGQLSPYDGLFRQYAAPNALDWRLLAAQCFQESRFDPLAHSWAGAVGLFQLMPATATELGVKRREDPQDSVRAGSSYLARLSGRVDSRLELQQRLRFALAAYNAGWGHVADAQRLARERGLDASKWFGNVEKAMLLLEQPAFYRRARHGYVRGSEPVKYVSEIQSRYDGYIKLVP